MAGREGRGRRAYRALLRLLPHDVGERFGRDMEEVLSHRLARARGSRPRTAGVWAGAVADVLFQSVLMRVGRLRSRGEGAGVMGGIWMDVRHAVRAALAAPGFSLLVVLTLGLGIGASTATWSVVRGVLLEDLPFEDPERLVFVWPEVNANKAMALLAEERMPSLERVSGLSAWILTLTNVGEPVELRALLVAPRYFDMLGVAPALGRTFGDGEDLPGAAGVVILSHDLWTGAFGADPGIVGRVIDLGGADYERRQVVGVMPAGVESFWEDVDLWVPLEGDRALALDDDDSWYVNERLARLAPGATLEDARREVRAYAAEVQRRLPDQYSVEQVAGATVQRAQDYLVRDVRTALWVALAAVGLVLLIACANVTNLLLARGDARARDLSVRAALGAGRLRMTRMLLAESAVLGGLGGALGVASAVLLVRLVVGAAPDGFPGIDTVSVDAGVLIFAIGITALSIVGAGLAPALMAGRRAATSGLAGGTRGATGGGPGRLTPLLVSAQIMLAVVVVVGSGLMLRSLGTLLAVDPGLDGDGVLVFKPNPPAGRYPDGTSFRMYYEQVADRVAALPGVASVGAIQLLPGTTSNWSFPTFPEGHVVPEGTPTPSVNFRAVRGDYFQTVRMPLRSGRYLTDADRPETEPVVLVNEAFVQRFWPDQDPLGRTLSIFSPAGTQHRVVGVVADIRQHARAMEPRPETYFSHGQVPYNQMSMWIVARLADGEAIAAVPTVREAVWSVDADVPIAEMAELSEVLGRSTGTAGFLAVVLSGFGSFALLLCAVGVFGVANYTSGRRRPEFGVRIALGSSRGQVARSAVRQSLTPVLVGLVTGLVGAFALSSIMGSLLYSVRPTDPLTYAGVALLLAAIGGVAAFLPAWRASRVDPVRVLGSE